MYKLEYTIQLYRVEKKVLTNYANREVITSKMYGVELKVWTVWRRKKDAFKQCNVGKTYSKVSLVQLKNTYILRKMEKTFHISRFNGLHLTVRTILIWKSYGSPSNAEFIPWNTLKLKCILWSWNFALGKLFRQTSIQFFLYFL